MGLLFEQPPNGRKTCSSQRLIDTSVGRTTTRILFTFRRCLKHDGRRLARAAVPHGLKATVAAAEPSSDHLLLRNQVWLLGPTLREPGPIPCHCAREGIGATWNAVRIRAPAPIADGANAAVSGSATHW